MGSKRFLTFPAAFFTSSLLVVLINLVQSSAGKSNINPKFGEKCNLTNCAKSLHCTDGICKCINPDYQIFDARAGLCRNIVGTKCRVDKQACVHGADCTKSKCQCKTGYVPTKQRGCRKSHGESCSQDDICLDPFVCKEGKCGCRNSDDVYSNSSRMCHIPIGYPCLDDNQCIHGSGCVFSHIEGESVKGTCECDDGFELDPKSDSCVSTACKSNFFRPVVEVTNETAFPVGYMKGDKIQLYSCRVKINETNETFAVGKAVFESKKGWTCAYDFNGIAQRLNSKGFEVLAKPKNGTKLIWVAGNHALSIPKQALLADGKNQYVVRCKILHETEMFVPGRLVAKRPRKVMLTWGYGSHYCDEYEMLICSNEKQ